MKLHLIICHNFICYTKEVENKGGNGNVNLGWDSGGIPSWNITILCPVATDLRKVGDNMAKIIHLFQDWSVMPPSPLLSCCSPFHNLRHSGTSWILSNLPGAQKTLCFHTSSSAFLLSPTDPEFGACRQHSPVHLLSAHHPPLEGDRFLSLLSNLWRR